jgi:micrococcal nuclease
MMISHRKKAIQKLIAQPGGMLILIVVLVLVILFDAFTIQPTDEPEYSIDTSQNTELVVDANQPYSVTSVVDGDTMKIDVDGTIETLRLIGINTPETVDPRRPVQCFGKEASDKVKELLEGQKVRIEQDPTQDTRDRYGRILAYVYREDGLFLNKKMIEDGYAYEYTHDKPYMYQDSFKNAEAIAKTNERGLWAEGVCDGELI